MFNISQHLPTTTTSNTDLEYAIIATNASSTTPYFRTQDAPRPFKYFGTAQFCDSEFLELTGQHTDVDLATMLRVKEASIKDKRRTALRRESTRLNIPRETLKAKFEEARRTNGLTPTPSSTSAKRKRTDEEGMPARKPAREDPSPEPHVPEAKEHMFGGVSMSDLQFLDLYVRNTDDALRSTYHVPTTALRCRYRASAQRESEHRGVPVEDVQDEVFAARRANAATSSERQRRQVKVHGEATMLMTSQ